MPYKVNTAHLNKESTKAINQKALSPHHVHIAHTVTRNKKVLYQKVDTVYLSNKLASQITRRHCELGKEGAIFIQSTLSLGIRECHNREYTLSI